MANRTGKSWSFQEDVTAANMNKGPQGCLARDKITSTQSGITTTEVLATGYSVTVATQGGPRHHRVEAVVHLRPASGLEVPSPNTAGTEIAYNNLCRVYIRKDGLTGEVIGRANVSTPSDAVGTTAYVVGWNTSATGSEKYVVTIEGYGLTTWDTVNGSTIPGWLVVTDDGPAF